MDLVSQLQVQLYMFEHFLEELRKLEQENASREEAMALIARVRKQREAKNRLIAKTLAIAGMRDKPVVCVN